VHTAPIITLDALSSAAIAELNQARPGLHFVPNQSSPGALGDRISESALILRSAATSTLFSDIERLFARINTSYELDITGMDEPLALIRYAEGGVLDWHLDCGYDEGSRRKLSVSVQLSHSTDYEGGDLEFAGSAAHPFARDQFAAIGFPCYLAHRVTNVARGTRESLVAWMHGPSFR
jgi:predicted 2-oxoglutarate/Fe(II)-dependent dioxygenase YbiX